MLMGSDSSKPYSNDQVFANLKFICKIKPGEKINSRGMYIQQDTFSTSLARTIYCPDNRENAYNFIYSTIKQAFNILSIYIKEKNDIEKLEFSKLILKDIKNSLSGIDNISKTYKNDHMFTAKLESLRDYTVINITHFEDQLNISIGGIHRVSSEEVMPHLNRNRQNRGRSQEAQSLLQH